MPFKLRSVIRGHDADVRTVCPALYPEGAVLTGSRDQTCRLWVTDEENGNFTEGHVFSGHTRYISAVATIPPSEKYPHGLVATGGHDNLILVFCLESIEPVLKLEGHTGTVSSIVSGKFGTLLSGSWDKSARVWVNGQCVMVLSGHTAAIWAADMMPEQGFMITGSADKSIKLWKAGQCEKTITGHTDCVRGLAVLSSFEFLSCSNDCDIRRWSITGDCLQIYKGHTNYVYSIVALPSGDGSFATCGEDRTLRIWKDNSCEQTIVLPCTSVWAVNCLANGDIIVGSSDSVTRIFTAANDRVAPTDVLKEFEEEVANQAIPAAANLDLGEIKKEELPGPEALFQPGNKDGQTKLVKRGNIVEAHQWDGTQQRWQKVGEVVGAAGTEGSDRTANKKVYNGKEYDYVFDVDIQEGKPPLKLPFNITDDPWVAAHKFLGVNDLSPLFLDQVAQFIIKNTEGVTLGQQSNVSDPFTGGSRYVPGSRQQSSDPQINAFQDPFTGGTRYVPVGGNSLARSNGAPTTFQDPFTGGTRYVPAGEQKGAGFDRSSPYFPKVGYLSFDTGKPAAIIGKLKEFNSQVNEDFRLNENDVALLSDTLEKICGSKDFDEKIYDTLFGIIERLLQWPSDMIFPGLDSVRLLIRHKTVSDKLLSQDVSSKFLGSVLQASSPGHPPANSMLAQRIFCNCFKSNGDTTTLTQQREKIIEHAVTSFQSTNKNWKVASSSTILNYCVASKSTESFEEKVPLVNTVAEALKFADDRESQFRLLVALGTLIWEDNDSKSLAGSLGVKQALETLKDVKDPPKVGECATTLLGNI
eukprot:Seg1958.5 transcript_id=Seg1958.5/GoldUCD/mRNA.D3Y31 product="Phospholipase A-2-activating protein" protein_id=Seg1958.5/GoldUCD/D3Y31